MRIGVRFFTGSAYSPASPLAEVAIRNVGIGAHQRLEISTANPDLFRDFYSFCCTLADRVQLDKQLVVRALTETLRSWSALIRRKSLLSDERQVGLFGELLFLTRVADTVGWPAAVDAWQGPDAQEHDFTLLKVDAEVKSTRSERRIHQIGSLTQLLPKMGRRLIVVSIQITPSAGKGSMSLSQLVSQVLSTAILASPQTADTIREHLVRQGWADEDAPQYATRYQQRAPLAAVPVDARFPAIVPETLAALGPERIARIERVDYAVDLSGLGVLDGTEPFERLLFER